MTLCALALYYEVLLAALATTTVAVACATAIHVTRQLDGARLLEWWRGRRER